MKKNNDGYFRSSFTFEGKRYYVRGSTQKELFQNEALLRQQLLDGAVIVNGNTMVKKWAQEWLETYKKDKVSTGVYKRYERNLQRYVVDTIGQLRIKDVKAVNLQKILNGLAGMSKDHQTKVRALLFSLFEDAYHNEIIPRNPAARLELPKSKEVEHGRRLTDEERAVLLRVADQHPDGTWVKLLLYCGLRPSESIARYGVDIDFDREILHVRTANDPTSNEIKPPKTAAGVRDVPIPHHFIEELKRIYRGPFEPLFVQPKGGKRHTNTSMRCMWDRFKRDLDIALGCKTIERQVRTGKGYRTVTTLMEHSDITPYDLRHTYCTDLQDAVVPINVAREYMGHSSIETTSKIYTHHSEETLRAAQNAINIHATKMKKMENECV